MVRSRRVCIVIPIWNLDPGNPNSLNFTTNPMNFLHLNYADDYDHDADEDFDVDNVDDDRGVLLD